MKTKSRKLQDKLWELCKQVVRKRDGGTCTSCGSTGLEGSNQQTGHFIPSSTCGAYLRYDLRNLHVQCMPCNVHKGGNGAIFYRALELKYGRPFVDKLFTDKAVSIKADIMFYQDKIYEFERYLAMSKKELDKMTRTL